MQKRLSMALTIPLAIACGVLFGLERKPVASAAAFEVTCDELEGEPGGNGCEGAPKCPTVSSVDGCTAKCGGGGSMVCDPIEG